MSETHFKKIKNSEFLGSCDLQRGQQLTATIKEMVIGEANDGTGRKNKVNVAIFTDSKIKPMIFNQTNCQIVRTFAKDNSPYLEDWAGISITIYIDYCIKIKGTITDGLRISKVQPKSIKDLPLATDEQIKKSIEAISTGQKDKMASISWYKKNTKISDEQLKRLEEL